MERSTKYAQNVAKKATFGMSVEKELKKMHEV